MMKAEASIVGGTVCIVCKKIFTSKRKDAKFCSDACRMKHTRGNKSSAGKTEVKEANIFDDVEEPLKPLPKPKVSKVAAQVVKIAGTKISIDNIPKGSMVGGVMSDEIKMLNASRLRRLFNKRLGNLDG
jgi:hypothetical protein